ncbi:MAG: FMN-binding protein [Clostridiales bacterium]|nr:FMN-binding protein [Clostridiales bacterium]MDY3746211.1 FMN-binding protein [Lachnospiraceae bacterium]
MILSLILAWLTVLFVIAAAFKYIARVSQSAKLNGLFHKIHIPAGFILIVTGLLHGLAAGNFADTALSDMRIGTVFFTLNWGTACFIVSVLLALSYMLRAVLKKKWMRIHRILTVYGAVTDISILEENDTPQYFERAKEIVEHIIDEQSLKVDAVSGATYSSVGILNAVNNALESAVTDDELEKNDTELPTDFHNEHGGEKRGHGHGNRSY